MHLNRVGPEIQPLSISGRIPDIETIRPDIRLCDLIYYTTKSFLLLKYPVIRHNPWHLREWGLGINHLLSILVLKKENERNLFCGREIIMAIFFSPKYLRSVAVKKNHIGYKYPSLKTKKLTALYDRKDFRKCFNLES